MASKEEKLAYLRKTPGGSAAKTGRTANSSPVFAADGPTDETMANFSKTGASSAAAGGSPAVQAMPDSKLFDELDRLEKELAKSRKEFLPGGLSKDEQAKLDVIQAKIDNIIKKLAAAGQVIHVSEPPPTRPTDDDGDVEYTGIPLEKLKDSRQQNIARTNARTVRDGVKSIDGWAQRLDEKSREHTQKQNKFEMVMARSEDVNAAFAKDLKGGGIKKLSKAAGPMFEQTMAGYEQAAADVEIRLSALKVQAYRIASARAMVDQAEMLVNAYNQEKERDAEGKKLAELKQKLDDLKGGVNFVIDAVKDPKGAAKDVAKKVGLKIRDALVDEIVDGLLGGEKLKKEVAQVETRIAALNQRLESLKLGGLNAGVNQAVNNLSAEVEKTNEEQIGLKKAKQAQGQAVDMLATMEKNNPNTTTVFGQLQQYYAEVQQAGSEAMRESKDYEKVLTDAQGAMAHTADLRQAVQSDRAVMNKLYPLGSAEIEDLQQQQQAEAIVEYSKRMDKWAESQKLDKQRSDQQGLRDDLRGNKQFAYIGKLVNAVQEQGLGHQQRDSKITQ